MQCQLNFTASSPSMEDNLIIQHTNLPSGHMSLPCNFTAPPPDTSMSESPMMSKKSSTQPALKLYPVLRGLGLAPISDVDLTKIHTQLSHCGAHTLGNLLRAWRTIVDREQIKRILGNCTCGGNLNRTDHPELTGRTSEFCGDVIGVDVVYPSVDTTETRKDMRCENFPALLIADRMSRCAICSLLKDLRAVTLNSTLMNDWIRPLGKPSRIIADIGSPGMTGREW